MESSLSSVIWPFAIVLLCACAVNWPCLLWGLQYGHDHNLHVTYLHFFGGQLRAGEIYPRWISGLNFGAGSPIFFVQYPLPYYVSAALQWVLRIPSTPIGEAHALGLFLFFTGIVSAVSCWMWCRSFSNPVVATLASCVYLTMPYLYSCDLYYRAAIGEYSALAWIPLTLFLAHRIDRQTMCATAGMALAFAAVVFSNLFTALLFAPFLFLYVICLPPRTKRVRAALRVGAALTLGVGLSSVYLLPMNANRAFFSSANMLKLGPDNFFYRDHLFPFNGTLFPTADLWSRLVDLFAAGLAIAVVALFVIRLWRSRESDLFTYAGMVCIVATCAAPVLSRFGLSPHAEIANLRVIDVRSRIFLVAFLTLEAGLLAYASLRDRAEPLARFLVAAGLAVYILSTRSSDWIWQRAPVLWNIQFPWRLTGLLSVFTLGLITLALRDLWSAPVRSKRVILAGAGLWLLIVGGSCLMLGVPENLSPPFFTQLKQRVETPYAAYASISHMPTLDELGPNDGLTSGALIVKGEGTARFDALSSRHFRLAADCADPCSIVLKLVYYPRWQAYDTPNTPVPLHSSKRAGLTELSLDPGAHQVDLELPRESSETWGTWLSFFSLVVAAFLFAAGCRSTLGPEITIAAGRDQCDAVAEE